MQILTKLLAATSIAAIAVAATSTKQLVCSILTWGICIDLID